MEPAPLRTKKRSYCLLSMLKPYVVSMEGPEGVSAVTYEAANDVEAFVEAARIIGGLIEDLDPTTVVEIMRPDATAMDTSLQQNGWRGSLKDQRQAHSVAVSSTEFAACKRSWT